jgi:DNA circularisation protein N-terminus
MATGTFNGVSFEVLQDPMTRSGGIEVTERHIPGGDTSYIDYAGKTLEHVHVTAYCANTATYANLRAARGVSGTFVYVDGSLSAMLLSADRTLLNPGGDSEVALEFILL